MRKLFFSLCSVLAILGCGGENVDELPLFAQFECEAKGNSSICRQIYYSSSLSGLSSSSLGTNVSGFVNFTVTDSNIGIMLGGTVTAEEGVTITAIAVTAGGNVVTLINPPALGVNSVNLAGTYVAGVCVTRTGTITVNFTITATASNGAQYTASKAGVAIDCGTVLPSLPSSSSAEPPPPTSSSSEEPPPPPTSSSSEEPPLPSSSSSSSGGESSSSVNNTPNVSIVGACYISSSSIRYCYEYKNDMGVGISYLQSACSTSGYSWLSSCPSGYTSRSDSGNSITYIYY